MAGRALELIERADTIAGYTTYMDLIRPLIDQKKTIATGMTREVDRVEQAIAEALTGKACALISGGDAGIYAMAGLVFEMCEKKGIHLIRYGVSNSEIPNEVQQNNIIEIEVVPGIPALAAGASLVGAPLTHDFCAISLSDLLTPWETIERRIEAAASADFVIAIYNPKSKKRDWQLSRARDLILKYRPGNTPVGIATSAMRKGQQISNVKLKDIDEAEVGMQTILFVGNKTSVEYLDFMYTPRGYSGKYDL